MKLTKRFFAFYLGLALLLLTACQSQAISNAAPVDPAGPQVSPAGTVEPDEAVLNDLDSLEELKEIFIQDAGKIRLVLLLSPT